MKTLEAKANQDKLDLLNILPRNMIRTGAQLAEKKAKFMPIKDDDGSGSYCAEVEGELWERVSHEGPIEQHAYILRATTRSRIQSRGFGEANEKYFNIIDGKVVIYSCQGNGHVEFESVANFKAL